MQHPGSSRFCLTLPLRLIDQYWISNALETAAMRVNTAAPSASESKRLATAI
jgi:hypothetical protein